MGCAGGARFICEVGGNILSITGSISLGHSVPRSDGQIPFYGVVCVNSNLSSIPYVGVVGTCNKCSVTICQGGSDGIRSLLVGSEISFVCPTSCSRGAKLSLAIGGVVEGVTIYNLLCSRGRRRGGRVLKEWFQLGGGYRMSGQYLAFFFI